MEPFESYVQTLESLASKFLNLNPTDDRDALMVEHALNDWLNERIRCRHLTVKALQDLPW